jgi:hypothetical protein
MNSAPLCNVVHKMYKLTPNLIDSDDYDFWERTFVELLSGNLDDICYLGLCFVFQTVKVINDEFPPNSAVCYL